MDDAPAKTGGDYLEDFLLDFLSYRRRKRQDITAFQINSCACANARLPDLSLFSGEGESAEQFEPLVSAQYAAWFGKSAFYEIFAKLGAALEPFVAKAIREAKPSGLDPAAVSEIADNIIGEAQMELERLREPITQVASAHGVSARELLKGLTEIIVLIDLYLGSNLGLGSAANK
ncbi:MAG: hypothetical protein LBU36_01655 [Clostridiales bacterium]|jgi:hypothetical protein|nr:hypothetical protein [Clostridiales bacterium]